MNILNKFSGKFAVLSVALTFGALAWAFSAPAQARDNVYWSVGIGSPGVDVSVGNAVPVYVQPQPVYVQPRPLYVQPPPVYVQPWPPYYYREAPPVVYFRSGDRDHWRKGRGRWQREDDDD